MANSALVMITKAPYGLEEAFAGLRLALAMSVNGMKTTVVMLEDGVYNAVKNQMPEAIKMPSNIDATKELFDFDVQALVVREDLSARGIKEDMIFNGLKIIPEGDLRNLVSDHDIVVTF